MCIVSSNWFGVWIGLELNLIRFIFYSNIIVNINGWGVRKEGVLIYFLIQALGSLLLLFFVIVKCFFDRWIGFLFAGLINSFIFCCLLLKLGIGPFYVWFPYVINKMHWLVGFILITWQKLAPFILCRYFVDIIWVVIISILVSVVVGGIGGFNELLLKKLLAYSSVAHGGWILGLLINESFIFYYYYFIYFFLVFVVVRLIYVNDIMSLNEFIFSRRMLVGMWWMMSLMSLGGLPPFLGFYIKWIGIFYLLNFNLLVVLFLILIALVSLFYYLRIIYSFMLISFWDVGFEEVKLKLKNVVVLILSLGAIFVFPFFSLFTWNFKLIKLLTFKVKIRNI